MTTISEVGHAKNVAHFDILISIAEGYGTTYNPSRQDLQLPQLYTILIHSQQSLTSVILQNTAFANVVNARRDVFKPLKPLSTRVINSLEACGASDATVADAKYFHRKIQGKRAGSQPAKISTSQLSYDSLIQHFLGLIVLLENEPLYTPNETQLTTTSLRALLETLIQQNDAHSHAYVALMNVRNERNTIIYHPETGLIAIAEDIKKYIKSAFGPTSPQYNQVKGIKFTPLKE